MLLLPTVQNRRQPSPDLVELDFEVPASLAYFPDHFPAQPMLPGVVQLGWMIHLAQQNFEISPPFREVRNLKFINPILPGAQLTLTLRRENDNRVKYILRGATREFSSGLLCFAHAAG